MGVLPAKTIRSMLKQGMFVGVGEEYVNPASLDIPFTDDVHRMSKLSKPLENNDVAELVREFGQVMRPSTHDGKYLLEAGVAYAVRIGRAELPSDVYAYANPKSSIGRINVLVRVVADRVPKYDSLEPAGWQGDVWLYVQPRSFPVLVQPGTALAQLRFLDGSAFLSQDVARKMDEQYGLFYNSTGQKYPFPHGQVRPNADKLHMTVRLNSPESGWVCDGSHTPLDLTKTDADPDEYFRPVEVRKNALDLHLGRFYILTTNEHMCVPAECAAELRPLEPRVGDFRVHAAGFIDPGFGLKAPNAVTLEVVSSEPAEYQLRHGEVIARVRYEMMADKPDVLYGEAAGSHYSSQKGARLAKFFKQD